jgi:quercetin dioxygenase-like cupin family protein
MGSREQAAEVRVPTPRLDEQRHMRAAVQRDLGPGDRSHAERLGRVRELERAVNAVVVGERERLVPELRRPHCELLRLRRPVEERVRAVTVELHVHLGCEHVVEIGEGAVLFRREELSVTLLVDVEQLAAVDVRAAPGWGRSPLHVHARHAEALFVFQGELALRLEDRVHRIGAETWALVPPEVVHTFEVTGDEPARYLVVHAPNSGYGDYVRGAAAAFDLHPPPEYASSDPGLVVVSRAGGTEGEKITDRPERRATILADTDEVIVSEFAYGSGERGAEPHIHRDHADAFLVVEGEFTFHTRDVSVAASAGTFLLFPPGVVHGFDNDSAETARTFNFHVPSSGFGAYLHGRNPNFDQHDPPADGGVDPSSIVAVRLPQ